MEIKYEHNEDWIIIQNTAIRISDISEFCFEDTWEDGQDIHTLTFGVRSCGTLQFEYETTEERDEVAKAILTRLGIRYKE